MNEMQFQFNSDYPGIAAPPPGMRAAGPVAVQAQAREPVPFPPVNPIPCAKITTRVFHPRRNQIATVRDVIVRTVRMSARRSQSRGQQQQRAGGGGSSSSDDDVMSSSSSSSSSFDDSIESEEGGGGQDPLVGGGVSSGAPGAGTGTPAVDEEDDGDDRAYWVQRTIREAIYGRVHLAVVLRRRSQQRLPQDAASGAAGGGSAEWEVTEQYCAVKEMSWQHIRRERNRLAEDPIKEVAAMQYLKRYHGLMSKRRRDQAAAVAAAGNPAAAFEMMQGLPTTPADGLERSFQAILETNIMMPLDLLSDDRHLYSIMPYCDGGELFERLDMNERFTEEEARYWMYQVLNGLEHLQNAGICHRDMSLENLLVHRSGALIIDMGMCLRIPYREDISSGLVDRFGGMQVNGDGVGAVAAVIQQQNVQMEFGRTRPRCLITPQGTCGKWIYMSPEIYKNREPFDGYAVDVWAAGVILFLMLTGFPPWERACLTDERFKYMTQGYLVQMLTEWEMPISGDAMDLLQRMLFISPEDRLSLDQVRRHPWMVTGQLQGPTDL